MKKLCILLPLALFAASVFAQDNPLKDERDKVSYSIGLDIGSTFKKQGMDVNADIVVRGMKDGMSGAKPLMTDAEVQTTMTEYSKKMVEKQQTAMKETAAKNLEAGDKFLAENKNKEGVKTSTTGLQFKVLKEGTGPTPQLTDTVVTNYRGTLIDGTEFDSSYKRNEPTSFPVNRVIKGWTEALQMMKVGSKYQLFIPSSLAYGERGAPAGGIGPNEMLIFELELLDIKPAPTPAPSVAPAASPAASAAKPTASPKASAKPETKASPKGQAKPESH
ncbi:MAG: FKBP-type peptidyl-prolyl cis-trans isomerase [Chthoniobacterales bacterium]